MPEVDEIGGLREALLERRNQGLAAGDELAVIGAGQKLAGIFDRRGAMIAGRIELHDPLPYSAA